MCAGLLDMGRCGLGYPVRWTLSIFLVSGHQHTQATPRLPFRMSEHLCAARRRIKPGQGPRGDVLLAPPVPGEIMLLHLDGAQGEDAWYCSLPSGSPHGPRGADPDATSYGTPMRVNRQLLCAMTVTTHAYGADC